MHSFSFFDIWLSCKMWYLLLFLLICTRPNKLRFPDPLSFPLQGCSVNPNHEAHLECILGSLPHLQTLIIHEPLVMHCHAALFSSLAKAASACCLNELRCTRFDAPSIQAVSKLASLHSLSWGFINDHDKTPKILEPLSSLTALRHLCMTGLWGRSNAGVELVLPHLQHLSSLKMDHYSPSQLAVMPPSLRSLELHQLDAEDLCACLGAVVEGGGLPLLNQLHIIDMVFLSFLDDDVVNDVGELPRWREQGLIIASHLAALPSGFLAVDHLCCVPWLDPFFAFIEPIPDFARGLKSIAFDAFEEATTGFVNPADLTRLAALSPNIKGELEGSLPCLCGLSLACVPQLL